MKWANSTAYFLLIFCVIFTTVVYGAVHQPTLAVVYFLMFSMVVLWVIDSFERGEVRFSSSPLQIPLFVAAAYGVIQVVPFGWYAESGVDNIPRTISVDTFSTRSASLHLFGLSILFSMALLLIDRAKRIRQLVRVITIFGFVFAFFAILQGVLSPTKIFGIYERVSVQPYGSFVNRHNFAAYMEMTIAIPLALVLTGTIKRDQRLLYLTAIVLMAVALFLSGSRGGLISLIAEILLLVMITAPVRKGKRLVLRLGLAGALLAAVVAGTIFVGGESSLTRISETASSKDVTSNRAQIWRVAGDVIVHNFPFGAGLGAFGVAYTLTDPSSGAERVEQAHNDYLQAIADAGIVGIIVGGLFIYLLVRTFLRNLETRNQYRRAVVIGAAAGIFAVLFHSLFDFVLHTTAISVLFLVLIAIMVAGGYKYADDVHSDDSTKPRRGDIVPLPNRF
jgi:O-antigen ligase